MTTFFLFLTLFLLTMLFIATVYEIVVSISKGRTGTAMALLAWLILIGFLIYLAVNRIFGS